MRMLIDLLSLKLLQSTRKIRIHIKILLFLLKGNKKKSKKFTISAIDLCFDCWRKYIKKNETTRKSAVASCRCVSLSEISFREGLLSREKRTRWFSRYLYLRVTPLPTNKFASDGIKMRILVARGEICETCLYRAILCCQIFICWALSFQRIRTLYNSRALINVYRSARERERGGERGREGGREREGERERERERRWDRLFLLSEELSRHRL